MNPLHQALFFRADPPSLRRFDAVRAALGLGLDVSPEGVRVTHFDWAAFVIAALLGVILGLLGMIGGLLRLGWLLTVDERECA